ncbi:hypothetical protein Ciccas_003701 [Cichlidogyrus casuarinus]|uniref:Uncharacterized protein n=1 Tax=Cichlidogyrus casuarinus TaxID=1844966 RepID=A0ABD2QFV0_9PLAT
MLVERSKPRIVRRRTVMGMEQQQGPTTRRQSMRTQNIAKASFSSAMPQPVVEKVPLASTPYSRPDLTDCSPIKVPRKETRHMIGDTHEVSPDPKWADWRGNLDLSIGTTNTDYCSNGSDTRSSHNEESLCSAFEPGSNSYIDAQTGISDLTLWGQAYSKS